MEVLLGDTLQVHISAVGRPAVERLSDGEVLRSDTRQVTLRGEPWQRDGPAGTSTMSTAGTVARARPCEP